MLKCRRGRAKLRLPCVSADAGRRGTKLQGTQENTSLGRHFTGTSHLNYESSTVFSLDLQVCEYPSISLVLLRACTFPAARGRRLKHGGGRRDHYHYVCLSSFFFHFQVFIYQKPLNYYPIIMLQLCGLPK